MVEKAVRCRTYTEILRTAETQVMQLQFILRSSELEANTLRIHKPTVTFFTSELCVKHLCPFTRFNTKIMY